MHSFASSSSVPDASGTCSRTHAFQSDSLPPTSAVFIARWARCLTAGPQDAPSSHSGSGGLPRPPCTACSRSPTLRAHHASSLAASARWPSPPSLPRRRQRCAATAASRSMRGAPSGRCLPTGVRPGRRRCTRQSARLTSPSRWPRCAYAIIGSTEQSTDGRYADESDSRCVHDSAGDPSPAVRGPLGAQPTAGPQPRTTASRTADPTPSGSWSSTTTRRPPVAAAAATSASTSTGFTEYTSITRQTTPSAASRSAAARQWCTMTPAPTDAQPAARPGRCRD